MNASIEKLLWYYKRLAAMNAPELAHRVVEAGRQKFDHHMPPLLLGKLEKGNLPNVPFDLKKFADLASKLEPQWEALWQSARRGSWCFLGQDWPQDGSWKNVEGVSWHRDPVTGRDWPADVYCFAIPFKHMHQIGDIKFIWELNRLQFLPPIAALAHYRRDREIRDWCLRCVESWIEENKPFFGVSWASGIELAIRVVSLILVISFLGADAFPDDLNKKLRNMLDAHGYWLARYPSLYSSANNHLISEAAAQYVLGSLMPDLPQAAHYKAYGHRVLIQEIEKQILPDGVGAEQSPTYTAFSIEWMMFALFVATVTGDNFPEAVHKRIQSAGRHFRWLMDSSGEFPHIGDDDEGRVIHSGNEKTTAYLNSIVRGIAGDSNDPSIAPSIAASALRDLFLPIAPAPSDAPEGSLLFDFGGYTIFRKQIANRETMLAFDHGDLGYLSIAAHGHADALSIWLHIGGHPVFIDAGTYLYHSGKKSRDYFRGSRAHNTLTLDDEDQSQIAGPFNWSRKANASLLRSVKRGGNLCSLAEHDGYNKRFGLTHQRCVSIDNVRGYLVKDRLVGRLKRPNAIVRLRFFVSPDIMVQQLAENIAELRLGGAPICSLEVFFGSESKRCALQTVDADVSLTFGSKRLTKCLIVESPVNEFLKLDGVSTRLVILPDSDQGTRKNNGA